MNNPIYKITSDSGKVLKLATTPKEVVLFRNSVGVAKQLVSASGIKTLWYHTIAKDKCLY